MVAPPQVQIPLSASSHSTLAPSPEHGLLSKLTDAIQPGPYVIDKFLRQNQIGVTVETDFEKCGIFTTLQNADLFFLTSSVL